MTTDKNPSASDADDQPPDRRWVRASEVAALVKHMGRVIPDTEWQAAMPGDGDDIPE